jgi:undecaprenyl-diphosphatase
MLLFGFWTFLVMKCNLAIAPNTSTEIGLSSFNLWFLEMTGVHLELYVITDWLGLVPVGVCLVFGFMGLYQLISRRSLLKVDHDLILLGIYYVIVIVCYVIFEMFSVNYRPILIEGRLEASYPSSTTLLVLCVMPTLIFQCRRRIHHFMVIRIIEGIAGLFSVMMVVCRLVSGVHWISDIVGSCLLSYSLYSLYRAAVEYCDKKE